MKKALAKRNLHESDSETMIPDFDEFSAQVTEREEGEEKEEAGEEKEETGEEKEKAEEEEKGEAGEEKGGLSEKWKFPAKRIESKTTLPPKTIEEAACGVLCSSRLLYAILVSGAFQHHIKFLVSHDLLRIPSAMYQRQFRNFSELKDIPWQQSRGIVDLVDSNGIICESEEERDQDTFAVEESGDTGGYHTAIAIQGWVKLFVQHLHAKRVLESFANLKHGQGEIPINVKVYGISSSKNSAMPTLEVLKEVIRSSLPNETTEEQDEKISVFQSYFGTNDNMAITPTKSLLGRNDIYNVISNIIKGGADNERRPMYYNLHCEAALTSLVAASKSPAAVEVTPYASQEMLADLYVGLVPSIQDNDSHLPTGIESKGGGSLEALLSCLLGLYRYLIQKIQQRWNKDVHNPRPPFHRLSCATA